MISIFAVGIILTTMNNLFAFIILAATICLTACCATIKNPNAIQKRGCPIKKETTAIRYTISSNSGIAVQTEYDITPDSLVWHYTDRRNGFILSDAVRYNRNDFDTLIDSLTQVSFKVRAVKPSSSSGGGGYAYSFFDINGRYLGYGVVNNVASGDNKTAEEAISQFIEIHKTAGEQAVEEAKEKDMLYIDIENFPESLAPYRVK